MDVAREGYDHLLPLHKRQCLVTIIFTNLPSLHPFSFHEMIFILVIIILGDSTVNSTECMVCLNKNYTNKRTKFKISASLQRDTQQVKNLSLHSKLLYMYLTLCCDAVCTFVMLLGSKHVLK